MYYISRTALVHTLTIVLVHDVTLLLMSNLHVIGIGSIDIFFLVLFLQMYIRQCFLHSGWAVHHVAGVPPSCFRIRARLLANQYLRGIGMVASAR